MTYALTRSFSHASHGAGHAPSSHIATYVPVTGVPNPRPLKTRDLEAGTCMLDVIDPQTWVDGVGVTTSSIKEHIQNYTCSLGYRTILLLHTKVIAKYP